jgi:hypothetical protein
VLLQALGQGLERWLLRDEGRVLLRVLGQRLERGLLRDEGRVLLRALGQGLFRGLGLPQWSRGQRRPDNSETRIERPETRTLGMRKT